MSRISFTLLLVSVSMSCGAGPKTGTDGGAPLFTGGGAGATGGAGGGGGGGVAGGGGATGGGGAALDCLALINCTTACAEGDQACLNACGSSATPDAITRYNLLVDCVNQHGCADATCVENNCTPQLADCAGSAPTGGGGGGGTGGGGGSGGLTTSGKCEIQTNPPAGAPPSRSCWDYSLTVTTNHNDGTETFVYFDQTGAGAGQQTCASSNTTYSMMITNPNWNSADISARNLNSKRAACQLSNNSSSTATFTEGAACDRSGAVGVCAHVVTNVFDPATSTLTATVTTTWTP